MSARQVLPFVFIQEKKKVDLVRLCVSALLGANKGGAGTVLELGMLKLALYSELIGSKRRKDKGSDLILLRTR